MEIIPAIDLRGGRCVRLYQGDFAREAVFAEDPVAMALRWQELGAPRLHVVDLDGAAAGRPVNLDIIRGIATHVGVPIQVGGGIRDLESALRLMEMGVERVVLGTAAVENPLLVTQVLERLSPEGVVVSVDARYGRVAVRGWMAESEVTALALVQNMAQLGVGRFAYTDIAQDGTLTEPNFAFLTELLSHVVQPLLAAGGIASVDQLIRLAELGVEGAIVGMALYTGIIDLPSALQAVGQVL